eukprot:4746-Heterococcus_DN1.PRE.2
MPVPLIACTLTPSSHVHAIHALYTATEQLQHAGVTSRYCSGYMHAAHPGLSRSVALTMAMQLQQQYTLMPNTLGDPVDDDSVPLQSRKTLRTCLVAHTHTTAAATAIAAVIALLLCCLLLQLVFDAAASAGAVDMLEWLRSIGVGRWDEVSLQEMLSIAGMCGHLTAAKWFRSQGALWPTVLWHLDDGGNMCITAAIQPLLHTRTAYYETNLALASWQHNPSSVSELILCAWMLEAQLPKVGYQAGTALHQSARGTRFNVVQRRTCLRVACNVLASASKHTVACAYLATDYYAYHMCLHFNDSYCCCCIHATTTHIQQGCPWGNWPSAVCRDLQKLQQREEMVWAHRHGCPCECEKPAPRKRSSAASRLHQHQEQHQQQLLQEQQQQHEQEELLKSTDTDTDATASATDTTAPSS